VKNIGEYMIKVFKKVLVYDLKILKRKMIGVRQYLFTMSLWSRSHGRL